MRSRSAIRRARRTPGACRESLSKGRALDPSNIDGLHLLADQVVANNGDYKCAKTILEAALKLDPSNARSNHYYSQLLSGMGEFDLAFQYADKALAVAGDADTRNFVMTNAGRPRYMAGQYDWALTNYLVSTPDAPLAHFYRSLAFGAKGMFTEPMLRAASRAGNSIHRCGIWRATKHWATEAGPIRLPPYAPLLRGVMQIDLILHRRPTSN